MKRKKIGLLQSLLGVNKARRPSKYYRTSSKFCRVRCAYCGARPGEQCIRPGGYAARETHMARIRATR